MGKIYQNQSSLRITATTGVDISGATALAIKYRKPSGTEGSWTATESDATEGIIYYDLVDENDLDEVGAWAIWGHVTFSDGRSAPGEPFTLTVKEEGR